MAANKKLQAPETALVLRTCFADLTSHSKFQWPNEVGAMVEAPDWIKSDECGNGLHGWLYGQGDAGVSDSIRHPDAKWLVVEVVIADMVSLGGKVKFPRCTVRHIGDKHSATQYLLENEPRAASVAVIGVSLTGGYGSTLTGGDGSTLTGGEKSELRIRRWDSKSDRYRTYNAYVGEDGIEADKAYRLDDNNKFVPVLA
jgi:hypothetical protein